MIGSTGIAISDFAAWVGWVAIITLSVNFALGILQPLRYDPVVRWPHRTLPASLFKLHKWVGYTALGLVLLHPLFLLWNRTHPFTLSSIYIPFTAPADQLMAGIGTVAFYLLLIVVGTSYFRLLFGLRIWKLIHYTAYALLPVMIVHGLFVNPDLNGTFASDYFDAGKLVVEGCAAVCLALVAWRLAYYRRAEAMDRQAYEPEALTTRPHLPWSGKLRLSEILVESASIKTFRFVNSHGGPLPFTFEAGQYVRVATIRNYTISSPPEERNHLDLTIKKEDGGFISSFMHEELRPGDLLKFTGPFGTFIIGNGPCNCFVMIAGGVGVTPFLSMIRHLASLNWAGQVSLIYSVRTPRDLIRKDELAQLQNAHPNFHVIVEYFFTRQGPDDSPQEVRRITKDALRELLPHIASCQVFLCGPVPMMRAVTETLEAAAVPPEHIFFESFGEAFADTSAIELERAA